MPHHMKSRNKLSKAAQLSIVTLLLGVVVTSPLYGQGEVDRNHVPSNERTNALERRKTDIDGNNIRATIFNFGMSGRTGGGIPDEVPYEWPKNTRQHYIALIGLFVGAEVVDDDGQTNWIVNIPNYRRNPVNANVSWTMEPVAGYTNPNSNSIARSDDPTTWPAVWPDKLTDANDPGWSNSWNGYFGKDVFSADQELFYKLSDDQYNRYPNYYPDSTDHTRKGLGLIIETRVLAWSQVLIENSVFHLHTVKNDGTQDLDKVGVTLWVADLVGGDGDANDDEPYYDLLNDVAWMTDSDGIGNQFFGSRRVGVATAAWLETPGNSIDRIDNDADGTTNIPILGIGEPGSPFITMDMIEGEDPTSGVDDNGNGLINENATHVPFGTPGSVDFRRGVGFADGIDNDGDGEQGSPVVTQAMIDEAATDRWGRWPANPESDPMMQKRDGSGPIVHLIAVGPEDLGMRFKDNIDNDGNAIGDWPTITQEMIDEAAADPYRRYRVPGTDVILYNVTQASLGNKYINVDGGRDAGIDEGIDTMIDESRQDGVDNDRDWRMELDDVGLDGIAFTGDFGEGDGLPTSGAGTPFPGEPNIDKTDVSESDMIGITNVQYRPAGGINFNATADRFYWFNFMVPGEFYDPTTSIVGDFDLFVSSGIFPLRAGQQEAISYVITMGEDVEDALRARSDAQDAYEADYQFAQAPITPTLTAVPGDGRITLYWDSESERTFDSFMARLGLPAEDFEGYRLYRATDPAFLDARRITDGFGNVLLNRPIAQFDLRNGVTGFHPTDINGVKYHLGDDTGLQHMFVDSTVTNGVTYYYALTAYDFGAAAVDIPPTETPIRVRVRSDGTVETGQNVARVTPAATVAGYDNADLVNLTRVQGQTTSRIAYEIVDPRAIKDGHRYRIVFEDTIRAGDASRADTLTTKNFTLLDITDSGNPTPVISRSTRFAPDDEPQIVDGFRLRFFVDDFVDIDRNVSGWNRDEIYPIAVRPYMSPGFVRGLRNPADYRIEVGSPGSGHSVEFRASRLTTLPARPTNFRVYNTTTGQEVKYAFWDLTGEDYTSPTATTPASFSAESPESDRIILIEDRPDGTEGVTWELSLNFLMADREDPREGDVATIIMRKPFLNSDVFEFETHGPRVDTERARDELENIRVVPNPYRARSDFEGPNPFTTGRGPRVINFINLPPNATIRIFNSAGELVTVLRTDQTAPNSPEALMDGSLGWNLESADNLTVAYGLYIYHIEAPGIGETTGTFAIIK